MLYWPHLYEPIGKTEGPREGKRHCSKWRVHSATKKTARVHSSACQAHGIIVNTQEKAREWSEILYILRNLREERQEKA